MLSDFSRLRYLLREEVYRGRKKLTVPFFAVGNMPFARKSSPGHVKEYDYKSGEFSMF